MANAFNLSNEPIYHLGEACINDGFLDKQCSEMTDYELADFLEQGAYRCGGGSDWSATVEAARRLREKRKWWWR